MNSEMIAEKPSQGASQGAALPHPKVDTVDPDSSDVVDPCPDPNTIVAYFFNATGSESSLEQHLRECTECRLKYEALKEAIRRVFG
jgi:hypothetical protein